MSDYQKELKIDINSLDKEFIKQASLYMKYAEKAATADAHVKKAKENLEVISATIDKGIRETSDKKPTETQIKSEILLNEHYQAALQNYNQMLYEYNILNSAVRAFDQKKSALENLVKLWAGQYFSTPKEGSGDVEETARAKQRERLNKRRK